MAPTETTRKKPVVASDPLPAEGDHRKRKRNRTTQSCLQCHHSKRMCDRKRAACGRCTQLGLTGLCVYETDDPNATKPDPMDETTRLRARVAELEGVVRKLKNKPTPKWMAALGEDQKPDLSIRTSTSSYVYPVSPAHTASRPSTSHSQHSTSSYDYPPQSVNSANQFAYASPLTSPAITTTGSHASHSMSPGYEATSFDSQHGSYMTRPTSSHATSPCYPEQAGYGDCGCLDDPTVYSAVLDLSQRLQTTVDTLGRLPHHRSGANCALAQRIVALDAFTTSTLTGPSPTFSSVPVTHNYREASEKHMAQNHQPNAMYNGPWEGTSETSSSGESYAAGSPSGVVELSQAP